MTKTILTLFALFTIAFSYSQNNNTIAKLKYQDAEEAFSTNNYALTITKLQETEELLNATNPKIMYLKILAQFGMIQKSLTDFIQLEKVRESVQFYMSKYGDIEGNEDKFRDIYKINEKLKEYPANAEEFKVIATAGAFMEYQYLKDIQLGWTPQQVQSLPQYKKHTIMNGMLISAKDMLAPAFMVKNNKIIGYSFQKMANSSEAEKLVNDLTVLFKFEPVKDFQSSGVKTYTWIKNSKTVMIMTFYNANLQMYGVSVTDENIK